MTMAIVDNMDNDSVRDLIEEAKVTMRSAENTLRKCYEKLLRSSPDVNESVNILNTGRNLSYTIHGLVQWAPIDLRDIESSPHSLDALDRVMNDQNISVDTQLERIVRPVMDYILLHNTRGSHSLVVCENGVEETLIYCNAPIENLEAARNLLRSTNNRCATKKLMVLLNETGDVEVVK